MKVLYAASLPAKEGSLELEREITALQRKFAGVSGEPVQFKFLPDLTVEEFALELNSFTPDVLHVSCHGTPDALIFSKSGGGAARLTADRLLAFMKVTPPTVLLLSACDSEKIADKLSTHIPFVIGTTAPITNSAARSSAVLFYDYLLKGRSLREAYEASNAIIESLEDGATRSILCERPGSTAAETILHRVPRIVVKFSEDDYTSDAKGCYTFDIGVIGCLSNTRQVVYFTDDDEIADENEGEWEDQMCTVSRTSPVASEVWEDEEWILSGDCRLFACGVTGGGEHFVAASTLCESILLYYELLNGDRAVERLPRDVRAALESLQANSGAKLLRIQRAKKERKNRK